MVHYINSSFGVQKSSENKKVAGTLAIRPGKFWNKI